MKRGFLAMLGRDLRLAYRQGSDVVLALAFFIIAASLFPLGVGPDPAVLAGLAAGVIWVLALLSVMLSLDRLFQTDYDDGALELMALSPVPMTLLVLAKSLSHWLTTGVPLLVLAPVIAVMLNMPAEGFLPLIVGLAVGTPTLSLIGAIGAALVLGARRANLLTALLVLPLYIPVLIFGVTAVDAALAGMPIRPHLLLMAAILAAALPLAPWAAAAAIRTSFQ
jgi:heme exporter protein B